MGSSEGSFIHMFGTRVRMTRTLVMLTRAPRQDLLVTSPQDVDLRLVSPWGPGFQDKCSSRQGEPAPGSFYDLVSETLCHFHLTQSSYKPAHIQEDRAKLPILMGPSQGHIVKEHMRWKLLL